MKASVEKKFILNDREYTHEQLANLAVDVALEKKATRPVVLDLTAQSTITDYFVILSAANSRQVYAIAEEIRCFFRSSFDLVPLSVDGLETCTWVLLDYGFLFVHVFQEPTREMYQLEQLWSKARVLSLEHHSHEHH